MTIPFLLEVSLRLPTRNVELLKLVLVVMPTSTAQCPVWVDAGTRARAILTIQEQGPCIPARNGHRDLRKTF